jgi:protein-serine/threonine kinase
MAEVKDVLHKMGIDVKEEAEYRLRCTRVRRRKGGPTTGLSTGFARVTAMGSSTSVNRPGAGAENRIPASPSGGLAGGLKGMLLRRGSSYSSSTMPRTDSDGASTLVAGTPASVVLAASTATATTTAPTAATSAAIQTLYGEHSIDNGDEVKFVVELCRIKNLNGLYLLSIKRLRGSVWSFKFIYQTIVERCDTLTH